MRRAFLLLALGACSESVAGGVMEARSNLARATEPSRDNLAALGVSNREFAFDLYRQAVSEAPGEDVVVSPYSVSTALAMTYAGARGTTESEMKQALRFTLDQAPLHEAFNASDLSLSSRGQAGFKLNVHNSLWAQEGFTIAAPFLDTLALNYGAGVHLTDFVKDTEGSRRAINGWVAEKTEQLIPELLAFDTLDSNTVLVLTNTVFLDAKWATKFEHASTVDAPFTRLDGSVMQVPTMNATRLMPYTEGTDFLAVALPYAGEGLRMIAILPAAGKLASVEQALNRAWFDALQWDGGQSVRLALPKFEVRSALSLKQALTTLGMPSAFGAADFSALAPGVRIDDVVHEAVIRVDEDGTVAAAATAVIAGRSSKPQVELTARFDRPFLYLIHDEVTGSVLFVGRVLDPR
ncbi:MAG: serpin family protein [Polyangiales bacterium]